MNKLFTKNSSKLFLFFFLFTFPVTMTFAQPPNIAQIEEPQTGIEILLFFGLLLFMLLAPAFKKREWPKLRKGYDYLSE